MARDMPESCEFPSLDSCQNRLLWTHKKVDLVLQVENAEKFPQALGLESLDPLSRLLCDDSCIKKKISCVRLLFCAQSLVLCSK